MNDVLTQQLLLFTLISTLGIWIGGATSLQVLLTRAQLRHSHTQTVVLMRQILWIVTRVFVPLGMIGVAAGVALVWLTGVRFTEPWVYLPLLLYGAIALIGSFFSLPEYQALDRLAQERGDGDQRVQQRLSRAAWVNRVELVLVYLVVFLLIRAVTQ